MVETIARTGATTVFSQRGIDDLAQHFLVKKNIRGTARQEKATWRS